MNPFAQGEPRGAASPTPDTYVWQVPGKPVAVYLPLSVVERLSAEIMRGYGANPKRSPEIGGVLRGTFEEGSPTIVRVEDFEVVPCEYRRGPSYAFTAKDSEPFEKAGGRPDAIGYFRSHTREGLAMASDDVELMDHFFPGPGAIALLVKPYATKPSVAGFFARENGAFWETSPLEFPFRRQELAGEEPPARRPLTERRPKLRDLDPSAPSRRRAGRYAAEEIPSPDAPSLGFSPENPPQPEPAYAVTTTARSRMRSGWVWIPLSFVFLLLGVALGFQAALSFASRPGSLSAVEFSLSLAVTKAGQNLNVHWDRQAPAVRASERGVLEIEEQGVSKPVELDAAQLQNGMLIYRNASNSVRFKLTVFPKGNVSVSESAEWKQ